MKIELKALSLKPNPMRNLAVDPIDRKRVAAIAKSIGKDGFWGGVVVGKVNGHHVILAGHNRVEAAIKQGETHGDFFVANEPTPETMLRIYATENATQRGDDNTSVAGTVAGAIRIVAMQVLSGDFHGNSTGRPVSVENIGRDTLLAFLGGFPGIDENVIIQQVANLKASGFYDKIIDSVYRELGLKRETEKVEPTFDLVGVQKHLHRPDHVQTFRKTVTGKDLIGILPIENQAPLSAAIIEALPVNEDGERAELTSKFIREEIHHQLLTQKGFIAAKDREALRRASVADKAYNLQHDFARHVSGAYGDLEKLKELAKDNSNADLNFSAEFLTALEDVQHLAQKLIPQVRRLGYGTQTKA